MYIVGRKRKMKWSQQDNLRLMSVNPSLQLYKERIMELPKAKVEIVRVFEG